MKSNEQKIVIESRTQLPDTNEYSYQLTYVMKEKNKFFVAPMQVFPPQNRDAVTIYSPFENKRFNLSVNNTNQLEPDNPFNVVQLEATYKDELNDNQGNNQWMLQPEPDKYLFADPWEETFISNPT